MKLPPLPQARVIYTVMPDDYRYGHVYGYTAADMRAYALDAIEKRSSSPAARQPGHHAPELPAGRQT